MHAKSGLRVVLKWKIFRPDSVIAAVISLNKNVESMKEIGVGIRIDPETGISSTGIDEVNQLIKRGAIVISIEPGGAIMRKLGEDAEDVRLTLSGCEMKVILDDSKVM